MVCAPLRHDADQVSRATVGIPTSILEELVTLELRRPIDLVVQKAALANVEGAAVLR
jgi:hypothetical protein